MKKFITLMVTLALAVALAGCSKDQGGAANPAGGGPDQAWLDAKTKNTLDAYKSYASSGGAKAPAAQAMVAVLSGDFASLTPDQMAGLQAVLETNKGVIKFKFYPNEAPETVRNFIKLAATNFYNGLIFHRIVPGFVIQGGDPLGTGTGGPGYQIKAEFNQNKHLLGTVAMARAGDPDSAGSQFYICLGSLPMLDNQYTVFGQVTEGIEVVQAIGQARTSAMDRPVEPQVMTKVYIQPL